VSGREPAWRVLAVEFNASTEDERGVGERAASYVLSPLGARMNRVLVSGRLAPPESIGRDEENPFLRARLEDPTGSISVTAGTFQPRAMATLRSISEPTPALVVGKAHLFRGRDGTAYASVRAETIRAVGAEDVREHWADAVEQTRLRLQLRAGIATVVPVPAHWRTSVEVARQKYTQTDLGTFEEPLQVALAAVASDAPLPSSSSAPAAPRPAPAPSPPAVRITRSPPPPAPATPSASERAEESAFLDVIDQLADRSADGYADVHELVRAAARTGVTSHRAEELLGRLEESGAVEEPIVGKLRRA
jgi:RPA family protein